MIIKNVKCQFINPNFHTACLNSISYETHFKQSKSLFLESKKLSETFSLCFNSTYEKVVVRI